MKEDKLQEAAINEGQRNWSTGDGKLGYRYGFVDGATWQSQHSQDEAVRFAEWVRCNAMMSSNFTCWMYGSRYCTDAELYQIFKTQI